MKQTICNMCGNKFNYEDESNNFSIRHRFGYGTKYDDDVLELDLCCECTEHFINQLVDECKIYPINES